MIGATNNESASSGSPSCREARTRPRSAQTTAAVPAIADEASSAATPVNAIDAQTKLVQDHGERCGQRGGQEPVLGTATRRLKRAAVSSASAIRLTAAKSATTAAADPAKATASSRALSAMPIV